MFVCLVAGISDTENYSLVLMEGGSGVCEVRTVGHCRGLVEFVCRLQYMYECVHVTWCGTVCGLERLRSSRCVRE